MSKINIQVNGADFGHIGWKYYNSIVKKAMEQEFSWSGLSISLSIAFFVVISCAQGLSLTYQYVSKVEDTRVNTRNQIYRLESTSFRNNATDAPTIYLS